MWKWHAGPLIINPFNMCVNPQLYRDHISDSQEPYPYKTLLNLLFQLSFLCISLAYASQNPKSYIWQPELLKWSFPLDVHALSPSLVFPRALYFLPKAKSSPANIPFSFILNS